MNYTDVVAALASHLSEPVTDPDLVLILPTILQNAEQRIYRELNLAATSARLSGGQLGVAAALTPGNRNLVLTTGTFVVLTGINVVSPVSAALPDSGVRNPLSEISWDALDAMFGGAATLGMPKFYALQDAATIAFGPWPDQAYPVEILGTIRPAPLSAANPTTTLSLYFPDLLIAACMVLLAAWKQNFGQQSDDPRFALSWETTYTTLLKSAIVEEARKKGIPVPGDV